MTSQKTAAEETILRDGGWEDRKAYLSLIPTERDHLAGSGRKKALQLFYG